MQMGILDSILEQKRETSGKVGEAQIKTCNLSDSIGTMLRSEF